MAEIRDIWLHAHNMIRSARGIINSNLSPLGLSSAEGNILMHLMTQGPEMGQDQLVEQLDVSKPAISRTLNSLEAKGYVTRRRDPNDRRAHRIQMTGKALEIGPAVEQVYNQVYTLAMKGISQEEFDYFVQLFARMSENFASEQAEKLR
ncbi:MAG: MarR family transcriptional regulator [Anaerolineales bacterium]|nr:MarR family transcriptional regulator [Anaerolineales bacterium]